MQMIAAIAAGGALGAVSRHYFAGFVMKLAGNALPYGIFATNVLGSFLMGMMVILFSKYAPISVEMRSFLTVGLLGAFTTFSTYSLDIVLLIERGNWSGAALYAFGSLFLGVLGLLAGMWLAKVIV